MSVNLSIKGVPERVAEKLRARAERHHRSLQGELMAIVEQAAEQDGSEAPPPGLRSVGRGTKTIEHLVAERLASGWQPVAPPGVPLAVDIIRADRDSR